MNDKIFNQLKHELAVSEIKTANAIDDTDNLMNMITLMTSGITPEEAEKIRNDDHHIERWKYGLSSPKQPDLKHDIDRLREFSENLRKNKKLSEEIFNQFYICVDTISDDVEYLADDKDAFMKDEYDFEPIADFMERYMYSENVLDSNIERFTKMCDLYADITTENLSPNQLCSKIVGHTLVLLSEYDEFYWWYKKNQS